MCMLCMQQLHNSKHTVHTRVHAITHHFMYITKLDNDYVLLRYTHTVKVITQVLHKNYTLVVLLHYIVN